MKIRISLCPHPGPFECIETAQGIPEGKNKTHGDFPAVQLLTLGAPNAGDPGSNPGQGTRSYMP